MASFRTRLRIPSKCFPRWSRIEPDAADLIRRGILQTGIFPFPIPILATERPQISSEIAKTNPEVAKSNHHDDREALIPEIIVFAYSSTTSIVKRCQIGF